MKKVITTFVLVSCLLVGFAQSSIESVLKKSYAKCQSVENGYYEMTKYMKYMSGTDTFKTAYTCHFKKRDADSLFPSAFHYQSKFFSKDTNIWDVLYTGSDLVRTRLSDSSATIMATSKWAQKIKNIAHNYELYSPLTTSESTPLPHDSDFLDEKNVFTFIGDEELNGLPVFHIKLDMIQDEDSTETFRAIAMNFHYWINKHDFMPIQYSRTVDAVMNKDTMRQYELFVLDKYEINTMEDDSMLSLSSIPPHMKIKDYVPYKSPELLAVDTVAPNWKLQSLKGSQVSLKDFEGELVLIDFFYKSCYPCMLALPGLQKLHEEYGSKGVHVIGIDPYDSIEDDDIANFLAKRGVTYTVLLGGKDVAKDYHVSGYPTLYLIGKTGKIVFVQVGYGEGVDEKIEEAILENL